MGECLLLAGQSGESTPVVHTHERHARHYVVRRVHTRFGTGSVPSVPACTAEVLHCFRPMQVEYEALLSPGGPYSRGIAPSQQRHLS